IGDDVVIKSEFIHRGRFAHIPVKIRRRYVGPFQVVKQISPVAFRVGLPESWRVHDTFHVSKLHKYERSEEFIRELEPLPPEVGEEGEEEFEVEAIIRHRGVKSKRQYLVVWKGYPLHESTWLPKEALVNAQEILADYLRKAREMDNSLCRSKRRRS
ncbi:MAG: chromo domain-containing protein, partial [Cytophagales bacterium]|nr:chromo domain-containing protein [Cytophagales bacterium]